MTRRVVCAALAAHLVLLSATESTPWVLQALTLDVSARARAYQPGEVVLVAVRPSRAVERVEGAVFNRSPAFWFVESGAWMALAGIPLDTRPGRYALTIRAIEAGGRRTRARVSIEVRARRFSTRRLRVDDRFLEPPASEVPRIASEARMLAALFAKVRQPRLWLEPFLPPVSSPSSSGFGRRSVYNGRSRGRHQGTDFPAVEGTPVGAPNDGEVVLASNLYFSGNTVVLDHGQGLFSLLAHLSHIAVEPGARVVRGERLGDTGSTGRVTGPHVHWTVRLGGVSVDPLSLMAASQTLSSAR